MLTGAALAGIGSIKSDEFEISHEEVRFFGDTAIVIEKLEIDGEMPPVGRLPPIKFMAVFQRTDEQWIMFTRAMTPCLQVAVERGVC